MMLCEHEWDDKFTSQGPNVELMQEGKKSKDDDDATTCMDKRQKCNMELQSLPSITKKTSRPTYGIKSDPYLQFSFLFAALIHDVDHKGVSNMQLSLELDPLAILYNDQSIAEQRSL